MAVDRDAAAVLEAVWAAHARGHHPVAAWDGPRLSLDQAYAVQLALLGRYEASGHRLAGWKVGLTSAAIQEQVGVHEPVFGFLLESAHRASGTVFEAADLVSPRIEDELCFTLRDRLTGPGVTLEHARRAIGTVAPALELVERRHDVTAALELALADNAQQRAFITGPAIGLGDLDPSEVEVEVSVDGRLVDRASGAAVLGDPVASVVWLADALARFDRSLDGGMRIMSGSFTRQHEVGPGDRVEAAFTGIGSVAAEFR
jgi:2-keto-4-pentenoate hydratase